MKEQSALEQRIANQAAVIRQMRERIRLADSLILALSASAQRNDPSTSTILK